MPTTKNGTWVRHKIKRHKNGKYFILGIGCRALCNYNYVLGMYDTGSIYWKNVDCKRCLKIRGR